jgi:anti-anti-sigma factor
VYARADHVWASRSSGVIYEMVGCLLGIREGRQARPSAIHSSDTLAYRIGLVAKVTCGNTMNYENIHSDAYLVSEDYRTACAVDVVSAIRSGAHGHAINTRCMMMIDESRIGPVRVIALSGRVDSTNTEQLTERLTYLLASGEGIVLLDLSGVIYLTSAAIRGLLLVAHQAELTSARFVICGVVGQVREIFEIAEISDAFTMHNSREDTLAKLA